MIRIACDGSCLGNPGPGGWAAVIFSGSGEEQVLTGGEPHTTNNRMELTAAIRGIEALPPGTAAVVLCDSQYVVRGITEWIPNWIRLGWKTARKHPVKNVDLWRRLAAAHEGRSRVQFQWVRGHAGHAANERAHELAAAAAEKAKRRTPADASGSLRG